MGPLSVSLCQCLCQFMIGCFLYHFFYDHFVCLSIRNSFIALHIFYGVMWYVVIRYISEVNFLHKPQFEEMNRREGLAYEAVQEEIVFQIGYLILDPTKRFKCFRLIHSTAISVAPLDKDYHPVKSFQKLSKFDHDLKEYYSDDGLGPKYFCMISLHPNRRALLLDI